MEGALKIARHPLHPILVTIPISLWAFAFVCDIVYSRTGAASWAITAYLNLGGGIVGALLAAAVGLFDLRALRAARERRIGITHMALNLLVVIIQAISFWLRTDLGLTATSNVPVMLSGIAIALLLVSGFLGGHLVHVYGVTQPTHGRRATEGPLASHHVAAPPDAAPGDAMDRPR